MFWASIPSFVCKPPIKILSGLRISLTAVPSARNSGFDKISKWIDEFLVLLSNRIWFSKFEYSSFKVELLLEREILK